MKSKSLRTSSRKRMATASKFAEFCAQFTNGELEHVVKIKKKYFYDPNELLHTVDDPVSVGLFLGEDKKSFRPTPALLNLLAKHNTKRIVLDEKSAWLFLCGRDILMQGVVSSDEFKKDELAIVSDADGNILGYGKVLGKFNPKSPSQEYVKNLLDKGDYLRRER